MAWLAHAWTVATVTRVVRLDTDNAIGVGAEVPKDETNMTPHISGDASEIRNGTTTRFEAPIRIILIEVNAAPRSRAYEALRVKFTSITKPGGAVLSKIDPISQLVYHSKSHGFPMHENRCSNCTILSTREYYDLYSESAVVSARIGLQST